jgi:hypothetical protein
MAKKLVVLADLGHFKAFQLDDDRNFSNPRLQLLEDWETNVTQHLSEELTDQAGQFRRGVPAASEGATAMSDGEQHNLDLERRRRAVKSVAKRINELLVKDQVEACYLAADRQINAAILDQIDQRARSKIQKNVTANLTRLEPAQVIGHFCEPRASVRV